MFLNKLLEAKIGISQGVKPIFLSSDITNGFKHVDLGPGMIK